MTQADPTPLPPLPPVFLGENELYDTVMGSIEPDLVSTMAPTLKEKYKDETPEQRQERGERYKKAFALYDTRLKEYEQYWNGEMSVFAHAVHASAEGKSRAEEAAQLSILEQSINQ